LNLKLSNSSHSERHFCSLAIYFTSKKTLLLAATGWGGGYAPGIRLCWRAGRNN